MFLLVISKKTNISAAAGAATLVYIDFPESGDIIFLLSFL